MTLIFCPFFIFSVHLLTMHSFSWPLALLLFARFCPFSGTATEGAKAAKKKIGSTAGLGGDFLNNNPVY